MEPIARIVRMEQFLNEAWAAVKALDQALDRYAAARAGLTELTAYYEDGRWMEDFEADAAGRLPQDLNRGVLSEDAVYNLLTDNAQLKERLRRLGKD
ncbi:MAG: DUF4298 domain-containing protein [Provencibacterium sp.]|jgi:hypothetical protein|nr:DUF4298 domain-containing protein [Provencibacterium sp.]